MATVLPTQNQWDWNGLGLKVKDLDASGNVDITGNAIVTGTLLVTGAPTFTGDTTITGDLTVNGGDIDAGASGAAGTVDIFPTTASKGKLAISVTDQTGNTTVSLVAGAMAAARTITIPDPGAAASVLLTTGTATASTVTTAELTNLTGVVAGTVTASKALVVGANKNVDVFAVADGGFALGAGAGTPVTSTAAELNKLDDSITVLTRGAGVDTSETYAVGYRRNGTLVSTRIVVDLSTLIGSATDLDIIGESAAASCNWGRFTTALAGTMIGGKITCLEAPAGGGTDIDFYSSDIATGTQDVIITDAALGTEVALVTSGGAWTNGATKGMTALPNANDYLYIVNGAAAGGTYTAGKFLIEIYGYTA